MESYEPKFDFLNAFFDPPPITFILEIVPIFRARAGGVIVTFPQIFFVFPNSYGLKKHIFDCSSQVKIYFILKNRVGDMKIDKKWRFLTKAEVFIYVRNRHFSSSSFQNYPLTPF